jgi:hypothetical protein
MSTPILPKNINTAHFKYSEVKTLTSGAKSVYINYATGKLRIQTPVMYLPYGVNEGGFEDKNAKADPKKGEKKEKKFDLTLSFKGHESNPKVEAFLTKLKEIEAKIIDDAFENREPWFKDDYDGQKIIVTKMFSPIIKIDKDKNTGKPVGKYPPTIRFKLPYDNENDRFNFSSYNMNGELIDLYDVLAKLKGGKAQLIVELNSIWFAGGKFGCTWKVITGKFQRSISNDVTFLDDSDTEKVEKDDEDEEEEETVETEAVDDTVVENSDNENYVEDGKGEETQEPQQVPVVEKKKGERKPRK